MANKTAVIEDKTYVLAPLSFGQGKELFGSEAQPGDVSTPLLRYSLNNADKGARSDGEVDAIPYPHAMQLIPQILEINGLRKPKPGEDQPAREAAAE